MSGALSAGPSRGSERGPGVAARWLGGLVDLRPGEPVAVLLSAGYLFCLFSAYYILRPIRDQLGIAGGVEHLAWLFTATLGGMLLVHPLFTAWVARLPRRR